VDERWELAEFADEEAVGLKTSDGRRFASKLLTIRLESLRKFS
jgi:hypothetical protein